MGPRLNKIVKFKYWLARDADDTCTSLREWCHEQFGRPEFENRRWYDDLVHGEAGFVTVDDANKFIDYINQLEILAMLKYERKQ